MNDYLTSELPSELREHLSNTLAQNGLPENDPLSSVVKSVAYISGVIEKRKRRGFILMSAIIIAITNVCTFFYAHSTGWKDAVQAYPHTVLATSQEIHSALVSVNETLIHLDQTLAKAEKQTH